MTTGADLGHFDPNAVAPLEPRTPLPAGKYIAEIVESEWKSTKNGEGRYISLAFQVTEGEMKGRKVFTNLNLINPNATAQQMAAATLSSICRAVGLGPISNTGELHNRRMAITVKVKPAKDGYDASNDISGFEPMHAAVVPAPPARPAAAAPAAWGNAPVAAPSAPSAPPAQPPAQSPWGAPAPAAAQAPAPAQPAMAMAGAGASNGSATPPWARR